VLHHNQCKHTRSYLSFSHAHTHTRTPMPAPLPQNVMASGALLLFAMGLVLVIKDSIGLVPPR